VTFDGSDALKRLATDVRAALEGGGFSIATRRLAEVQDRAYTTDSEWLKDLDAAVKAIRNQRGLPVDLRKKLEVILAEIRRVSPTS